MTYAFTYDVPINAEIYARIKAGLGPERPSGLIAHLTVRTDSGLRYVDVWQTKDDWESFAEQRLHPVVHPLLQDMLGFMPPEPEHTMLDVIDAWTGEYRTGEP
jgi:hypothetical protein